MTADVSLVNSEDASVGQAMSTKEVEDLPSNGGTPMMLASLAMRVVATGQPSTVQPFASGGGTAGGPVTALTRAHDYQNYTVNANTKDGFTIRLQSRWDPTKYTRVKAGAFTLCSRPFTSQAGRNDRQ